MPSTLKYTRVSTLTVQPRHANRLPVGESLSGDSSLSEGSVPPQGPGWLGAGTGVCSGPRSGRVQRAMKIVYTLTDEAPALATASFLPIIRTFAGAAGIEIEVRDISLSGRILAQFPDRLSDEERLDDALSELGELAKTDAANIIKLPNISASMPQLKAAIAELQEQGYDIPDYPESPSDDEQREIRARYDKVKGSAVNPVLRQGNSDRRAPASVKRYARQHPHSMGEWSSESRSHVSTMSDGDFRATEQSVTAEQAGEVRIEHVGSDGEVTVLKDRLAVQAGEVLDSSVMHQRALAEFLSEQITQAKEQGVLFSVHLKATMMKVSDPIIFGHAVQAYFAQLFERHGDALSKLGVSPDNGLGALLKAIESLPEDERKAVEQSIEAAYRDGPKLAMVDSDRGITNLHVPSDVIIDASMPAAIRTSGQMWNAQGELQDTKFVIPDHSYAPLYAAAVEHCREHGAFDPATMGTTPNVGLMAQAAEEYGSHDKTFALEAPGTVRVVRADTDETLMEHEVDAGDIWRMCQTKDAAIQDWVRLAVARAKATGAPAVFWLDETRAHDAELLKKVLPALEELDTDGARIEIKDVARGGALHAGARPGRRGHDLGDRQRAARLPHRSVPDPRAGHQRQDALDRPVAGGRRAVRDRRRRLGPQTRPAAPQGGPPALGLAGRVPRPGALARAVGRQDR